MNSVPEQLRHRLTKERDALKGLLERIADEQHSADEWFVPPSTHGQDDEAERVVDLEMGIITQDNLQAALREIEESLLRIEAGIYGTCIDCKVRIPEKRLQSSPSVRYCIDCQIKHEGM